MFHKFGGIFYRDTTDRQSSQGTELYAFLCALGALCGEILRHYIYELVLKLKVATVRKIAMGELLWSCGRKKLLLRNGHQVRPQIRSLIGQAELDPQVFAVKIDGGFGNI